jgi:hypothetical protein
MQRPHQEWIFDNFSEHGDNLPIIRVIFDSSSQDDVCRILPQPHTFSFDTDTLSFRSSALGAPLQGL